VKPNLGKTPFPGSATNGGKVRDSDYFQFEQDETTTNMTTKVSNMQSRLFPKKASA
jgi:hypothetical protein